MCTNWHNFANIVLSVATDLNNLISYFLEYSEVGGDEELPLGAEFQAHINSFINPNAKSSLEKYKMTQKIIKQMA